MRAGWIFLSVVCFFMSFAAFAGEHASKEEAVALFDRAVKVYEEKGFEEAKKAYADPSQKFIDRDLYVTLFEPKGMITYHGGNAGLIGKNVLGLKDKDGKFFIKEMFAAADKGGGWTDYYWANPVTKKVELKSAYSKKLKDGNYIMVGYYK